MMNAEMIEKLGYEEFDDYKYNNKKNIVTKRRKGWIINVNKACSVDYIIAQYLEISTEDLQKIFKNCNGVKAWSDNGTIFLNEEDIQAVIVALKLLSSVGAL